MNLPSIVAVVPAAGIGSRMQADRPKQYLSLHKMTIIEHTLRKLLSHPQIKSVVVALNPDDDYFKTLKIATAPGLTLVEGGNTRGESVINALQILAADSWALVHDAARPCVSHQDISQLINHTLGCAEATNGGILVAPVRDTMKRGSNQYVTDTVDRSNLWHALTPQLFPAKQLLDAYQEGMQQGHALTDEASAMEYAGHKVKLVEGHPGNIKITHPDDLALASFYLQQETS